MWLGVKKREIVYALFFLLVVTFSCSKPPKEETANDFRLNIQLNSEQIRTFYEEPTGDALFNRAIVCESNGGQVILAPDKQNHQILFYRATGGRAFKKIQLELEGPNGVKQISNFQYKNDTLYVVDSFAYTLVLFNDQGESIRRIKLINPFLPISILPRYFSKSEMIIRDGKVFILGDADVNISDRKSKAESKSLIEVDISSGEIKNHFALPKLLRDDLWMINQHFFSATNINDSIWVYSYDLSDSLYLYTLGSDLPIGKSASSLYHNELKAWGRMDSNSPEAYKYYLANTSYFTVIYDPWRNFIYRLVQHPNESAIVEEDLDKMWDREFSLMVLDMNMHVLSERRFKKDEGILRIPLVDSAGFWMAYSDSETREIEGVVKFIKIDFQDIDEL